MAEHKVRTTLRPDETITVDDAELLDLQRQGLVHEDKQDKPRREEPAR